jgi:hypothetical protein
MLPLAAWTMAHPLRLPGRRWLQFFAGSCLIANGGYLGIGWMIRVGDAHELIELGTPRALLCAFGIVALPTGLLLWHRLGPIFPKKEKQDGPDRPAL